ncbi:MAG: YhdP family phospholipid transporter [Acidiferrobacter thiooxydans]
MVGLRRRAYIFWHNRSRGARYALATAGALFALLIVALASSPLWLTPLLQTEKPALEAALTRDLGAPVRVRAVAARVGWRPGIMLQGVTVMGRAGPAVALRAVRVDLSWLALTRARLWPAFIGINGARLNLRKTAHGVQVVGLVHHSQQPFHWRRFLAAMHAMSLHAGQVAIAMPGRPIVSLQALDASWTTGIKDHTLTGAATIPGVCGRCLVTVEFSGHGVSPRHFRGALGVHAMALDLHAAAALTGRRWLRPLAGTVGGQLWTTWNRGRLDFVGGDVALAQAFVPANRFSHALAIAGLAGRFSLKIDPQGFRFFAADVRSSVAGVRSHTDSVYVAHHGAFWDVDTERLRLTQVAYVAARLRSLNPKVAPWLALRPRGTLTRLHLRLGPRWRYHVRVRFTGLGLGRARSGPFFAHAAGRLIAGTHSGRVVLSGLHGLVRGPASLPGPLTVQALTAELSWHKDAYGLSWELPALHLASTAGTVDAAASGAQEAGQGQVLLLDAALHDVRISALKDLYPRTMRGHLRQWLTRTVRGGVITDGHVTFKGPLKGFPFRNGGGLFQATLHIRHGRYRFLPHWPSARHLAVTVAEHDAQLSVQGSGVLGGVVVPALSVRAGPLGTPTGLATVRVHTQGDLGDLLTVVLPHVRAGLRTVLPATISGGGGARLALILHIPFSRRQGPLTLHGRINLAHATLRYPLGSRVLHWRALAGWATFNDAGPESARLSGHLLGGPFTLALTPRRRGGIQGQATGLIDAAHVKALAGPARRYVGGALTWHLHVMEGRRLRAQVTADVRQLALHLPYPAGKARGVPAVAHFTLLSDHSGVFARGGVAHHLTLAYAGASNGPPGLWVGIGSAVAPKTTGRGLTIGVRSGYLAVAPWLTFVQTLSQAHVKVGMRPLVTPRAFTAYVGSLAWAGRSFGTVHARFRRHGSAWAGVLEGPDIAGTLDWRPQPRPTVVLQLDHLTIPAPPHGAPTAGHGSPIRDPEHLPAIHFSANSLTVGRHYIGRVVIDGAPYADGFRFQRIDLVRPHASLTGFGQWSVHGGLPESLFTFAFHSQNFGHMLEVWGLPHQVAGGRVTAHGTLNWPGGPAAFSVKRLEANIRFLARNGRFVKVQQGAGKLLGIFNVDSITHYLTLDFSSIFGRGFAFDRIDGDLIADSGVAETRGIHIEGASANVLVSGKTDLVAKTFDLRVRVQPHIQNNVTLATGLLGGPIAGAVVLLMQKIFAHEIDQGTRLTYYIKGPWSQPNVQKKADKG